MPLSSVMPNPARPYPRRRKLCVARKTDLQPKNVTWLYYDLVLPDGRVLLRRVRVALSRTHWERWHELLN